MSHSKVRAIFATLLTEYALTKDIRVSYDNVKFDPTVNELYLQTHLIPVDTPTLTLGGDHKEYLGIYQVKIISGSGSATGIADSIIDDLQNLFPVYKLFKDLSGFTVQVYSPVHSAEGKAQDGRWTVPCYFEYRADTN